MQVAVLMICMTTGWLSPEDPNCISEYMKADPNEQLEIIEGWELWTEEQGRKHIALYFTDPNVRRKRDLQTLADNWTYKFQRVRVRYIACPNEFTIRRVGGPTMPINTSLPLPDGRWVEEFSFYSRWRMGMKELAELASRW